MGERRSALLGTSVPGGSEPGLRELPTGQSRWHTCLVPPRAQRVLARACAEAYDAGFWYGEPAPEVPRYARELAAASYERGVLDALAARA